LGRQDLSINKLFKWDDYTVYGINSPLDVLKTRYTEDNMSESLESLLAGRNVDQPPEIAIIQGFVMDKFNIKPEVIVHEKQIIITVKGAGLAGALRPLLPQLQDACSTQKRLVIRIQ
jgi:hypothetical protein